MNAGNVNPVFRINFEGLQFPAGVNGNYFHFSLPDGWMPVKA